MHVGARSLWAGWLSRLSAVDCENYPKSSPASNIPCSLLDDFFHSTCQSNIASIFHPHIFYLITISMHPIKQPPSSVCSPHYLPV
ncbi:hypothetical protein C8Q75DRAFT_772068 [Abortiporus biennis]|nr:hypothetical protein C8Q75DRAFT_772068 [Abortiporus biennis]